MKTTLILIAVVMSFTGCSLLVPVKPPKFPEAPKELFEKMPDLAPLPPGKKSPKDLLDNVAENYGLCYQYLERNLAWEKWYNEQKSLYEKHQK